MNENACLVVGTPYDDTMKTGASDQAYLIGGGGNDTLEANGPGVCHFNDTAGDTLVGGGGDTTYVVDGPYDVQITPSSDFNTLVVNDATGNPQLNTSDDCIYDDSGCVAWWSPYAVQDADINGNYTFLGGGSSPVSENIPNGANVTVSGGTQLDLGDGTVNLGSLTMTDGSSVFAGSITANSYSIQDSTIYADLGDPIGATANLTADGNVTLVGQNTYTGLTTITEDSTLSLGDGWTDGTLAGNVLDNGTLVFDTPDAISFDGNISGDGSVVTEGTGTLTLSGVNGYTGGTTTEGGTIIFSQPSASPIHGIVTATDGGKVTLGFSHPWRRRPGRQLARTAANRSIPLATATLTTAATRAGPNVVEFYLQPISQGTTNYTTDFEMRRQRQTSPRTTSPPTTPLRDDLLRRLRGLEPRRTTPTPTTAFRCFAFLNFTSTGTISASEPSSLGLSLENGFVAPRVTASTGRVDRSERRRQHRRWLDQQPQPGGGRFLSRTHASPRAAAAANGSGDRTNVLLGVLAYTYTPPA